jgi:feruloyl esterase
MRSAYLIASAVIAALSASAHAQTGQAACERLRTLHGGSSRILSAEYSVAGESRAPGAGSFNPPPIVLPAHCSVRVFTSTSRDSGVTSEIWLPDATAWNGKLLATGNGGYSSALSYRQMAEALQRGFAVAGSDTGHEGDGLAFGSGHPEKIRDWAYRSTHVLAADAKAVVAAFYGKGPAHAYFAGCSTGGQQALSEAQRYPQDFDGIVAGDPGNDRILLNADFVASWLVTHPANGPSFPASKLAMLSKAVLAACDKQDALEDGIIGDPSKCSFDPHALLCKATEDRASCLTDSEVSMVQALYDGPLRKADGTRMFPGWPRGSEAGWGSYLILPAKPVRLEFWSDWVFAGASFNMRTFNASTAVSSARAKFPYVEAIDPDLRPFQRRGGKLLLYHGWADAVVPPEDTIGYYERVKQLLGSDIAISVRLFMVPGMGHCAGGPGATTFDAVGALDQWVTGIMVPESIPASHQSGGATLFERPLCAYPKSAQWDGKSDPAKASSFRCMDDHTQ